MIQHVLPVSFWIDSSSVFLRVLDILCGLNVWGNVEESSLKQVYIIWMHLVFASTPAVSKASQTSRCPWTWNYLNLRYSVAGYASGHSDMPNGSKWLQMLNKLPLNIIAPGQADKLHM